MTMKNNEYTNMTMAELEVAINELVTAWNESDNESDRIGIQLRLTDASNNFNKMSLLNTYAVCLDAESPVIELIQTRTFRTLKGSVEVEEVTDPTTGRPKNVRTMLKVEGAKKMYLVDFLNWCDKQNKKVTADEHWSAKVADARRAIIAEWEKFFNKDTDTILSKKKAKEVLQNMFDAIVFIPTEKDATKNAVIANGDAAKIVIAVSNEMKDTVDDKGNVNFEVTVLGKKKWNNLVTDIMYMAINKKSYTIVYGEPEKTGK